jgi:hypothetical protein
MKCPPPPNYYYATMLNVLGMGLFFGALDFIGRRYESTRIGTVCQFAFLGALVFPLKAIRKEMSGSFPALTDILSPQLGLRRAALIVVLCCIAAGVIICVARWRKRLVSAARVVLLIVSPLVPIFFGQAMWRAARYDPSEFLSDETNHPRSSNGIADRRVVWIVFDELDQRLTFDARPMGISLPEFDMLRDKSVYASNARGPKNHIMLSLIMGKYLQEEALDGPRILHVRMENATALVNVQDEPSIFSKVLALGYDTALVGWYIPYCRILGSVLTRCYWCEMPFLCNSLGTGLHEIGYNQLRSLLETQRVSPFGQSLPTRAMAERYSLLLTEAMDVAADPSLGLILIHLPVPHPPYFYSRRSHAYDLANSPASGYLDHLELADRSLGSIRRSMQAARLWESTTVLVMSDHSFWSVETVGGKRDPRVPFLLKLPEQHNALPYGEAFSTIVTHDLLLSVLRKEISSPEDVTAWLNRHRGDFPVVSP